MRLIICKPRGFCAGVVRAIETVEKAISLYGSPIYVKHQIVHNKHVVDSLKKKGAIFIEDLSKIPKNSRLIYSAHGVSPKIREQAKKKGLVEIDATCNLVTKLHVAAKKYSKLGYKIILIGHKKHVEVMATAAEAEEATYIVESIEDVKNLHFSNEKLFYMTQTTLSIEDVKVIVEELKRRYPKIETLASSSICYATTNRQKALSSITEIVDLVLVVGDPTSSNSNRLKELATKKGVQSYLINDSDEIDSIWLKGVNTIAMTAGASTPEYVVKRCVIRLKELGVKDIEQIEYIKEDVLFPLPI